MKIIRYGLYPNSETRSRDPLRRILNALEHLGAEALTYEMAEPQLHDFETSALVAELAPNLQIVAEYNTESYNDLYVSDDVIEELGGQDEYDKQRKKIEDFLRMDYIDRHAYGDIVPRAGDSDLFVTQAANVLLIRLFVDDDALFVSVERDGSIGASIDTVEGVVK